MAGDDIRKGAIIELDGKLLQILDIQHVKMKRTALLRMKLRDIRGGHTTEQTFQSSIKFKRVRLEERPMQFLYQDGGIYHFMDQETFEQIPLSQEQIGDGVNYLKENMTVNISFYEEEIIGIELPITIELTVTATDPGYKGDTATGGNKLAKLETGISIQVPLFINEGDIIKIDTRTGEYLERVNQ